MADLTEGSGDLGSDDERGCHRECDEQSPRHRHTDGCYAAWTRPSAIAHAKRHTKAVEIRDEQIYLKSLKTHTHVETPTPSSNRTCTGFGLKWIKGELVIPGSMLLIPVSN